VTNYFLALLNVFFPIPMVMDSTKHLFSLGPESIKEIASNLQDTVAPSSKRDFPYEIISLLLIKLLRKRNLSPA